jgi:hypothetical protein
MTPKPPPGQLGLDFDALPSIDTKAAAAARRDDGMTRAVEHADAVEPDWSTRAYVCLAEFCRERGALTFLTEDVRAFALNRNLPPPPDGRAWGAVIQRAAREGLIVRMGYAAAKSSNLSPKVLWGANG